MWEIGYKLDCKLDGWETTYEDNKKQHIYGY